MREFYKDQSLSCGPPDFECVKERRVDLPSPGPGEALVRVAGTALQSYDHEIAFVPLGIEFSGVVAAVGRDCDLQAEDRIWNAPNFTDPAEFPERHMAGMAEYAIVQCRYAGLAPKTVDLAEAGTDPGNAITALGALQAAGVTAGSSVMVTAGTGAVGYMAVQIAKAMGASTVVTAAGRGNGVEFVWGLGADIAVDYHKASILDVVADGSMDVVMHNARATLDIDRMVAKVRPGGTFVTIVVPEDGRIQSAEDFESYMKDPSRFGSGRAPPEVRQIFYGVYDDTQRPRGRELLDTLAALVDSGKIKVHVNRTYDFDHIKDALATAARAGYLSRIGMVPVAASQCGSESAVCTE